MSRFVHRLHFVVMHFYFSIYIRMCYVCSVRLHHFIPFVRIKEYNENEALFCTYDIKMLLRKPFANQIRCDNSKNLIHKTDNQMDFVFLCLHYCYLSIFKWTHNFLKVLFQSPQWFVRCFHSYLKFLLQMNRIKWNIEAIYVEGFVT